MSFCWDFDEEFAAEVVLKLIFVAPILVHADKLNDEAPRPKAYALTVGSVRA